jgi:hypothetical protein
MISVSDIIYFTIYIICTIASFKARRQNIPGLIILRVLLCLGLLNEIAAEFIKYYGLNENLTHYFYIPAEFGLLVLFYARNTRKKLLIKIMYWSAVLYIIISLILALFYYHLQHFPSAIYDISCLLNSVFITIIFFDLNAVDDLKITSLPLFWILTALLVFYASVFFFSATYNYLLEKDHTMGENLRVYVNVVLNDLLYILLSYGFICSTRIKSLSYL